MRIFIRISPVSCHRSIGCNPGVLMGHLPSRAQADDTCLIRHPVSRLSGMVNTGAMRFAEALEVARVANLTEDEWPEYERGSGLTPAAPRLTARLPHCLIDALGR